MKLEDIKQNQILIAKLTINDHNDENDTIEIFVKVFQITKEYIEVFALGQAKQKLFSIKSENLKEVS